MALAATTAVLASCGAGERTFDAEAFVTEANEHGAGLVLGPTLRSSREDADVRDLSLTEPDGGSAGGEEAHAGGSLTVLEDGDAALAEHERCETSASLICFRAANVVMIFEGSLAPADHSRLVDALRAMVSD